MQQGIDGVLAVALQGEQQGRPALPVGRLQVSAAVRQVLNDGVRLRAGVACRHMQGRPPLQSGVRHQQTYFDPHQSSACLSTHAGISNPKHSPVRT